MRALDYLKKSLALIISITLIHTPIVYAQSDADQNTTPVTNTTSQSSESSHSDPNWCLASKTSEVNSCKEQNLSYNCHLQVCAKEADNNLYNEEYNECNARAADQRDECRANLQSLGKDLIDHNQLIKDGSNPDAGSNGMNSTVVAAGGAVAAAAMGCGAFGVECVSGSGAALVGVVGLAVAFMAMQAKQYEKQLEQAEIAYRLDPLSFATAISYFNALTANYKYDEAEKLLKKIDSNNDGNNQFVINRSYFRLYTDQKKYAQAIAPLKKIVKKQNVFNRFLGYCYAKTGDTIGAYRIIDTIRLRAHPKEKSHQLAVVYAGLKVTDSVLHHLDTIRNKQTRTIKRERMGFFDYLKDDAQFVEVLKSHGINPK